MAGDELTLLTVPRAAEAAKGLELSEEGRALLADGLPTARYLDALIQAGHHADAARVLAHALPKREAVWWACRCARESAGSTPTPEAAAAIQSAETWAAAPGDVNRRKTFPPAEAAGFGTPAGCAAAAAWFSGGSLAPSNLPAVPPAEHLTGDCVANAVQLAALADPLTAAETLPRFLAVGLEVARGRDRWKDRL